MRTLLAASLALFHIMVGAHAASAQDYPARTVTVVVPQSAGGTNDVVARFVADRLSQALGQRFIVENRVGAGGNIGTSGVARAPADGYTLLITSDNALTINPHLYKSVGYDPAGDFEPITLIATVPYVLVVNPRFPASTLPDLIRTAKSRPDTIKYGSSGVGTVNHLLVEMLGFETGTTFVHVPYRGVAPLMTDLIGGYVEMGYATMPAVQSHIAGGTLRALGVSSPGRLDIAPDIPAVAEIVPGYGAELWVGLFAVRGTPPAIVATLKREVANILSDPATRAALSAMGAQTRPSTGEELTTLVKSDGERWRGVISRLGLKID